MGIFNFLNKKKTEAGSDNTEFQKSKDITTRTVKLQLFRFNQEIDNWKLGIDNFEDVNNPTNAELITVYNDVMIDAHLSAAIDARKSKNLSKDFKIVDEKGEEIEEETAILNAQWFRDCLSFALDAEYYGHTLIQLGKRVGKSFESVKIVPREYVYAQKKSVRNSPYENANLTPYYKGVFKPWTIEAGRDDSMGLLMKASPLVIFKKTGLGSWAEFTEIFGSPLRVGKTNVRDETLSNNMYDMLENMGRNAFGVLDTDDEIEFVRDSKQDAYNVFNELIERTNSELSKLVLGSTMTLDDGSSKSQSEVHERTTAAIEKGDALKLEDWVNNEFIPMLNTYHGFNIVGKWKLNENKKEELKEQFFRDLELIKTGKYVIPTDYLTETYGMPLEEVKATQPTTGPKGGKPQDVENSLKKKALLINPINILQNENFCDICAQIESNDVPEPVYTDVFIDDVVNGVLVGKYTVDKLPENLYLRIADEIEKGMFNGLNAAGGLEVFEDDVLVKALRNNAFQFSGAKTFQQVREMSDFVALHEGGAISVAEYQAKAKEIFGTYNKTWLRTEIAQASNTAQMASKWQEIEEDKDIFPFLKYDTVGDAVVRPDHAALDGVIKPVDSKFWDSYYPPNGWNCRCDVQRLDEDNTETKTDKIDFPNVPDSMKFNAGKQKVLFSPQHPYFIVEDQFKELKGNNFNLPKPKPLKVIETGFKPAKTVKEVKKRIENLGVDLFRTNGLSIEYSNNILEAIEKIPKEARPSIISDFTNYGKISGRKLTAQGNRNFGLKSNRSDLKINKSELTDKIEGKYDLLKSQFTNEVTIYDNLNIVSFNSRKFKKPTDILKRKIEIEKLFNNKNESYFINSALKDERFTMFHEFGHVLDTNKNLTNGKNNLHWSLDRWFKQTKIGHLKANDGQYREAFADAFADYYTTGGKNLPSYLMVEMDKILK